MNLEAIVRISGDGQLKDGSEASREFRQFLTEVESEKLSEYATYCVTNAFDGSGQVLQDIINEVGRRLGFAAENGRYQGVRNDIGYDGIWTSGAECLVIEVKTTDTYTIKLDVIARYRDRLVEANRVPKDTPILLVIGRNDTESLEAQVRGSKHAWSMRIIGINALLKLMEINLGTTSVDVTEKIHTILRPFEYTRIDKIVDVVFTAAEDKEKDNAVIQLSDSSESQEVESSELSSSLIDQRRLEGIAKTASHLNLILIKRRRTFYSDHSDNNHVAIAISKKYESAKPGYWYGYTSKQSSYLREGKDNGFMIYGLLDSSSFYCIPFKKMEEWKLKMHHTNSESKERYWHVRFEQVESSIFLKLNGGELIDLLEFKI